ncbi:hypothetical protein BDK51DRAFT_52152 [Blyttiomyces helicus]|uniref:SH3 domain-containing protein n=1 Tax=Blyttiomyces helicus TaxID=388810 RepID=A0A4P9W965_9FUNG|nr:hypothetical protein BDK51DRAFT_52152 [Blyttiomyces helicus]|eukprot:RKO88934.1 hypothetical protein BDK51DRAFT_52152 [Blyttiomyces helicus]
MTLFAQSLWKPSKGEHGPALPAQPGATLSSLSFSTLTLFLDCDLSPYFLSRSSDSIVGASIIMRLPLITALLLSTAHLALADQPDPGLDRPVLLLCPSVPNATFLYGGLVAKGAVAGETRVEVGGSSEALQVSWMWAQRMERGRKCRRSCRLTESWNPPIRCSPTSSSSLAPSQDVWRYDTPTALWTRLAPQTGSTPLDEPSRAANIPGVASCIGSTIYATLPDNTFASFDVTTNVWNTSLRQPSQLISRAATFVLNNTFWAVASPVRNNVTLAFDPGLNTWSEEPPYPFVFESAGGATVGGVGYVFGGETPDHGIDPTAAPFEALESGANQWTSLNTGSGPRPPGRKFICLAPWKEKLVLWGGSNAPSTIHNTLVEPYAWSFHTPTGTWLEHLLQVAPAAQAPTPALFVKSTCVVVGSALYMWVSGKNPTPPYGLLHKVELHNYTWISGQNIDPAVTAPPSTLAGSASSSAGVVAGWAVGAMVLTLVVALMGLFVRRRCCNGPAKARSASTQEIPALVEIAPTSSVATAATGPFSHDPPPVYIGDNDAVPPRSDQVVDDGPAMKVYRALCGFQPRADDEVTVKLGDEIVVIAKLAHGWARIENLTTGTSGLAPISAIDVGKDFAD